MLQTPISASAVCVFPHTHTHTHTLLTMGTGFYALTHCPGLEVVNNNKTRCTRAHTGLRAFPHTLLTMGTGFYALTHCPGLEVVNNNKTRCTRAHTALRALHGAHMHYVYLHFVDHVLRQTPTLSLPSYWSENVVHEHCHHTKRC